MGVAAAQRSRTSRWRGRRETWQQGGSDSVVRAGRVAEREVPEARESLLKLTSADSVEKLLETARKELPSYNRLESGLAYSEPSGADRGGVFHRHRA